MHRLHIGMLSTHSYSAAPERLTGHYGNAGVPVLATPQLICLESELIVSGTHERFVVETSRAV
jgi:hypothetical protein